MARKKTESKQKVSAIEAELSRLRPVEIKEEKEGGAKGQTEEESKEEKDEFETPSKSRQSSGISWNIPPIKAPVLNSESPAVQPEPENLESQVKTAPATSSSETPVKQEVYVTRANVKYEAGGGEYTAARAYENTREQAEELTRAKERGMAGIRLIQNPVRAPVLEETRSIDVTAWQVEHPMTSRRASQETFRHPQEEYVLDKKEKHQKTKLPFEE